MDRGCLLAKGRGVRARTCNCNRSSIAPMTVLHAALITLDTAQDAFVAAIAF